MAGGGDAAKIYVVCEFLLWLAEQRLHCLLAFAAFFTVFEMTRRVSSSVVHKSQDWVDYAGLPWSNYNLKSVNKVINACTLVTGGVSPVPFDEAL